MAGAAVPCLSPGATCRVLWNTPSPYRGDPRMRSSRAPLARFPNGDIVIGVLRSSAHDRDRRPVSRPNGSTNDKLVGTQVPGVDELVQTSVRYRAVNLRPARYARITSYRWGWRPRRFLRCQSDRTKRFAAAGCQP